MTNKKTFQHKMNYFRTLHCAAVNTTRHGPPNICCIDLTASCTNSEAISACVFVNMMLFAKVNIF